MGESLFYIKLLVFLLLIIAVFMVLPLVTMIMVMNARSKKHYSILAEELGWKPPVVEGRTGRPQFFFLNGQFEGYSCRIYNELGPAYSFRTGSGRASSRIVFTIVEVRHDLPVDMEIRFKRSPKQNDPFIECFTVNSRQNTEWSEQMKNILMQAAIQHGRSFFPLHAKAGTTFIALQHKSGTASRRREVRAALEHCAQFTSALKNTLSGVGERAR